MKKIFISILIISTLMLASCKAQLPSGTRQDNAAITYAEFADILADALKIDVSAYNRDPSNTSQGFNWLLHLEIAAENGRDTDITAVDAARIFNSLLERNYFKSDFELTYDSDTVVTYDFAKAAAESFKNALQNADAKFNFSTEHQSFLSAVIVVDNAPADPTRYEIEDSAAFIKLLNDAPIEKIEYAGAIEHWNEAADVDKEYGIDSLCNIVINADNTQNLTIYVDKDLQTVIYNNYAYTIQQGYLDIIKDYADSAK